MPLQFYSAIFSIKCSVFDYEIMLQPVKKIEKFVLGLETGHKSKLTAKQNSLLVTLRIVIEFKNRGFDFREVNGTLSGIDFIVQVGENKLIMPFYTVPGIGIENGKKIVNERAKKAFQNYDDFKKRTPINKNHDRYFMNNF